MEDSTLPILDILETLLEDILQHSSNSNSKCLMLVEAVQAWVDSNHRFQDKGKSHEDSKNIKKQ